MATSAGTVMSAPSKIRTGSSSETPYTGRRSGADAPSQKSTVNSVGSTVTSASGSSGGWRMRVALSSSPSNRSNWKSPSTFPMSPSGANWASSSPRASSGVTFSTEA